MLLINSKLKKLMTFSILATLPGLCLAAVSLDRTRVIFPGDKKAISLTVKNDNELSPYLAQSWLEDSEFNKVRIGPFIVSPMVQRIEPGQKSSVRISQSNLIKDLPTDRESLYYFNLREVPPKSDQSNSLQIALQTKIKFFYRPESILPGKNYIWQEELIGEAQAKGYVIKNPTPYYISVIGVSGSADKQNSYDFKPFMIEPKSDKFLDKNLGKQFYLSYINDWGGTKVLEFNCLRKTCKVKK
ncbi:hypothetical protein BS333_19190 [Vibrio azureus]|uniref:Molecular chaperone n=3 Tax=Vibrio TaxID=662 RepID=A0A511QHE8_9VIBR|nr:hypothetical protein BS333_19190 [Vibrio azureus]PNQ66814.1 hypothetical protein C1141_08515 [Vibrio agarivorans]GAD77707.1 putative fimbrial chaperone protein [Vibrio azureus NBRC 104587]GEM76566.1 molecular chaperone [Vibrio sagamiensis NBRC 104589]